MLLIKIKNAANENTTGMQGRKEKRSRYDQEETGTDDSLLPNNHHDFSLSWARSPGADTNSSSSCRSLATKKNLLNWLLGSSEASGSQAKC